MMTKKTSAEKISDALNVDPPQKKIVEAEVVEGVADFYPIESVPACVLLKVGLLLPHNYQIVRRGRI